MKLDTKNLVSEIDKRICERSILKHPFYADWQSGKLTIPMLKEYAKQYYKHVAAFPQYLSGVHFKMDNFEDRKLVLQNLMDEENGPDNHPELWMRFAESLGISRDAVNSTTPTPETTQFVNHFKNATANGTIAEGIAALYTYESQIPRVSEEKICGLIEFYGIDSRDALEYFKVHMHADIEHSEAERKLIMKYAKTEEEQEKVLKIVDSTLDAYWNMLTGVQKLCGKAC
ncbi:MAG TPA: CADD family putative folate metabolism protein [Candidatus Nanoarchaeia archaeon]|nr:CADD family putative folate metabolism protein [Candidatus Nanoarchaeia archaeon]